MLFSGRPPRGNPLRRWGLGVSIAACLLAGAEAPARQTATPSSPIRISQLFKTIPLNLPGSDYGPFLKDDAEIVSLVANNETLGYELPNFVELEVVETDPGYRGDTVSGGSTKPAKLESGASVQVPFHINIGDVVKVDTRTDTYLERVKR